MSLFLVHGWATTAAIWPDWLTTDNAYCYHSKHYPDYSHLAKTFTDFCQQQQEPTTLVGWSLGGMLVLQLAATYPELIKNIVLISSTPRFTSCEDYTAGISPSIIKNLVRKLHKNKSQAQLDFYRLMFSANELSYARKFLSHAAPLLDHIALPTLHSGLLYLLEQDLRSILPSIHTPCHILHGTEDEICLPAASQYLADMLPNATLTLVPGAGHIPYYTQEEYCKSYLYKSIYPMQKII